MKTSEVELIAFCFMIWAQAYESQRVKCGGLNMTNSPWDHMIKCIGTREWNSERIRGFRMCGFAGGSISLGMGFEV